MSQNCIYLFALSFTAGNEAGLALVSAESANDAFITLKNGGKYNGFPEEYSLVRSLQLGVYTENRYELLLEMYTNALVAFDALVAYYSHLSLYNFPEGGIPYADLSIQVQNILNRINELTVATTTADGLMSSADKIKLDGIESGAEENIIDAIKVNGAIVPVTNKTANITITSDISPNPTIPDGTTPTALTGLKIGDGYYDIEVGGMVMDVTVGGASVVDGNGVAVVPAIPTVNDSTLTIKMNNASKGTFSANSASNTEIDLGTVITSHQDISGKADKVSGATNGHFAGLDSNGNLTDSGKGASDFGTYSKPSGGIPKTDLESEVQTSIGKADTAYQKPVSGIPATDLASGVIPDVSNFITKSVNDLVNYYTKTETYTQAEVQSLIGAINQFHYEIAASTSAVTNPQSNVLYLIGPTGSGADRYEEYVYTNSTWTKIGDTSVDLSGYATTSALNTALAAYTPTANLATVATSGSYNDLSNTPTIPTVGTLNTYISTGQATNSSESLSGTIKLHKISKTGNYNDLRNLPTIPTLNLFIVTVGYDSTEDVYSITNDVSFADLCAAFAAGKALILIYTDEDGYAQEYTLSDYAADDGYITFAATFSPGIIKGFTIGDDDAVTYGEAKASTSDFTNNSMFVRGNSAIWQGTSITSASTAAKTAAVSNFLASDLAVGVMVVVTFSNTNLAAPNLLTLNIASRGAKPIKRWVNGGLADIDKPENLTGTMAFIYDGTNWVTWYESFDDIDGNCLDAKFGNVTMKQWKPDYTMVDDSYVKGSDGLLYEYSGAKYVEVAVGDAERVRFLGLCPKVSSWTNGWAFGHYESDEWVTDESEKFEYDTSQDSHSVKDYVKTVPSGATHFRTSSASSSWLALERNFYLYFQTGEPAVSQEELREAVKANPTVPSGTSTTSLTGLKIGSSYYNVSSGGGTITDVTVGGTSVVSNGVAVVPAIPDAQIQSDWAQTTTTAKDYIKNKPTGLVTYEDSQIVISDNVIGSYTDFQDIIPQIDESPLPKIENEVPSVATFNKTRPLAAGGTEAALSLTARINVYKAESNKVYYIDVYDPSSQTLCSAQHTNYTGETLLQEYHFDRDGSYKYRVPITSATTNLTQTRLLVYNYESKPIVHRVLRVLCIGASWHMNTWWYLNKMFADANVVADIHAYYMGHSQFHDWIQLYNNNLDPLSNDEVNRDARYCTSVNGEDWTSQIYHDAFSGAAATVTAQQYRNAFYNDITTGDWDIIAFQQGAKEALSWEAWSYYSDFISILRKNLAPGGFLAFNGTWTPGVDWTGMSTYGYANTVAGQRSWQEDSNYWTKKFMVLSGQKKIAPIGALVWTMRRDNTLNLSNDMTSDNLHLQNGLPMYAAAGCWWETYIQPSMGISFDSISWLPTSSTQKIHFNGSGFQTISSEQQELIRKYVKLSLSDRFGFRTN